ncbi:MAG: ATP synthase F1 subunit delta [Candidatus Aminicenantes bacterium]|jgi:F-type H+-transporting ATPase subunit delta
MKNRVLVKRYSQGLVNAIHDEEEFAAIHKELRDFLKLIESQEQLKKALQSPFLPLKKKKDLLDEVLQRLSLRSKTARFISLSVDNGRLEFLPEILDFLPELWNEEKGISTFEVFSVVPLNEEQKEKLKGKLEGLEQRPVFLKYASDPSLVGGLSIRRGNIVYDVSIRGNLDRLKENIIEG